MCLYFLVTSSLLLFWACHLLFAFSGPVYLNSGKEERQAFPGIGINLPIASCSTLRCLHRLHGTVGQARTSETSVYHWLQIVPKSLAQSILVSVPCLLTCLVFVVVMCSIFCLPIVLLYSRVSS